jgi:hypothetical protein
MADDPVRLPYLETFRDQGGKLRCYVRDRSSKKRIALAAAPGTPEFMVAYRNALVELGLAWLGLASTPEMPPQRRGAMHRRRGGKWQQFQIARDEPGGVWRVMRRTKCV